jgi:hypothetical protein
MARRALLALAVLSACYTTPKPNCAFRCGPGGECPAEYVCVPGDGICHLVVAGATAECPAGPAVDAPPEVPDAAVVTPDAPVPDAPVVVPDATPAMPDAPPPKPDAPTPKPDAPPPPVDAPPPIG